MNLRDKLCRELMHTTNMSNDEMNNSNSS